MKGFHNHKILIVDDDPVFRLMLQHFLKKHNFKVLEASSGKQALTIFQHENPIMVLMDADMPEMDGFETCRRIRELDPDERCPILIITAMDDDEFISKAFESGAADYVNKPIHWNVLEQRMKYKLRVNKITLALEANEERFRSLYLNSPLPYQSLDMDGRVVTVNPAWLDMLGYELNEVIGHPFRDFLHPNDQQKYIRYFSNFIDRDTINNVQYKMIKRNKMIIDVEANERIGQDRYGEFKQTHCVLQDVTKRNQMEADLIKLATTDPLTGLANRRCFFTEAELLQVYCTRYHHPLTVMMLDIDHFKHINDTYGHDTGDFALKMISSLMQNTLRDVDILGRIGGEEFAIVLPEINLTNALVVANRIRRDVEALTLDTEQGSIKVRISIGLAEMSESCKTIDSILKRADHFLYQAKQKGRNRVDHEPFA